MKGGKDSDYVQGSLWGGIISFSLPYLLSYFLQLLYGLADLYFIGRWCGVESTTAVSIGSQIMHMVTVVIVGLAMGTTVMIARATGARDGRRQSRAIGNTATLFLLFSVGLTLLLTALRQPIIRVMSTPADAVSGTSAYLTLCFLGIPFITAYNIIASVFRGLGDSRSPLYFIAVACGINILLDILFIGKLGMGPAGAALATVLSQTISVAVSLAYAHRQRRIRLSPGHLRPDPETLGQMLRIGVPISLQDGLIQVGFLVITIIANRRGLDDAAAVGIVEKLIGMIFLVPSAMLSTVSTLAAQNMGAGRHDRARRVLWDAVLICTVYGLAVSLIIQPTAEGAVGLFTGDGAVIRQGGQYLRSYIWDTLPAGIHFSFSGFFCAYGQAGISFLHNMASLLLARIPLAWTLSAAYPDTLYPMGWSAPAGSLLSVLICLAAYAWLRRRGTLPGLSTPEPLQA